MGEDAPALAIQTAVILKSEDSVQQCGVTGGAPGWSTKPFVNTRDCLTQHKTELTPRNSQIEEPIRGEFPLDLIRASRLTLWPETARYVAYHDRNVITQRAGDKTV